MWKFLTDNIESVVVVLVILFGSIAHATAQLKVARDNREEFNRIDFFILMILSSFSGGVFGVASQFFFSNQNAIILFSSVGAFLGMAGLNKFANALLDFLVSRVQQKHDE